MDELSISFGYYIAVLLMRSYNPYLRTKSGRVKDRKFESLKDFLTFELPHFRAWF